MEEDQQRTITGQIAEIETGGGYFAHGEGPKVEESRENVLVY